MALHQIPLGPDIELVLEQLLQEFGRDILVLDAAHFGQKAVGKDSNVRLFQTGGGEDIDHLGGGRDGLGDELPDVRQIGEQTLIAQPSQISVVYLSNRYVKRKISRVSVTFQVGFVGFWRLSMTRKKGQKHMW